MNTTTIAESTKTKKQKNAFDYTYESLLDKYLANKESNTLQIETRVFQGYVKIDKDTREGENIPGTETALRYLKKVGAIESFKLVNIDERFKQDGTRYFVYQIDVSGLNIKAETTGKFGKYSVFYKAIKNMLGYKGVKEILG